MSERARTRTRRDAGMTLPEVLIAVMVTGVIVASMASATQVVLRQSDNTAGRVNNARSEQSVGIWLPADLASAEEVDTSPGASPCTSQCPPDVNVTGSNSLMLSWSGQTAGETSSIPTRTSVSYRYIQAGEEWQIIRVECPSVNGGAPTCHQVTVLHDVSPPPPGTEYFPGETSPTWVMLVTLAIDPADPGDGSEEDETAGDPTYYVKNGRRVTVTINGGGDIAGAGGGADQITLSAGGVNRESSLSTTNISANPTFAATRSRCGGNFGLVIDTSGSIGSNIGYVRSGVTAFVDAFAGTPVKLQVVRFSTTASTLGSGSGWSKYFDMLNEADVTALKAAVDGLMATGGTNYEDALFRMFRNNDGSVQQVLPSTVVFFTDGVPTYNRLNSTSATSSPAVAHPDDSGLPAGTGSSYNQLSWNRANRVLRQFEVDLEKLIGVYVGVDVEGTSQQTTQGAGYHLTDFIRGYHQDYDRGYHLVSHQRGYYQTYQRAGSGLTYQKKSGSSWVSVSRSTYESKNTVPGESDGYRAKVSGSLSGWTSTSQTNYSRSNTTSDSSDGFRVTHVYSAPYSLWESTTAALYDANNTTSDETDGWRATIDYSAPFTLWADVTESAYNSGNSTPDDTDGWRALNVYSSPYSLWQATDEASYNAGNSSWGTSDGWSATKVYAEPYTFHENSTTTTRENREILQELIAPGGVVPAQPVGGTYSNAQEATYYELPNWSQFSGAMTGMALAECGGTVTLQTRVGTAAAADPFTYQNSVDLSTATTSGQYRSGTFDFELAGGGSTTVEITPLSTSTLERYEPEGWTCRSGGVSVPFTETLIDGGPWTKITLTVSPNQAISCVNQVSLA